MLALPAGKALNVGAWARDPLWRKAQAVPSLDLDFATTKSLVDRISGQNLITFGRAGGTATYVDATGTIVTAAANEPRFTYDPVTLRCLGLLVEELRTNLLLRSEEFDNTTNWGFIGTATANAITAPNGTITADLATTSGTQAQLFQATTISSGATITGSCFLKPNGINETEIVLLASNNTTPYGRATFNVSTGVISVAAATANGGTNASASIQAFANGWYRCSVTVTYPAVTAAGIRINAPGATGGFYLWGAQLEAGAFPTSYIPTTGTQATRNADVATIAGAGLAGFYSQSEGTFYWSSAAGGSAGNAFEVSNGTSSNRITGYNNSPTQPLFLISSGGVNVFFNPGTIAANSRNAHAAAYKASNNAYSLNGGNPATDSTILPPVGVSMLTIGANSFSSGHLNGPISRFTYFPQRLPNAKLQAITA